MPGIARIGDTGTGVCYDHEDPQEVTVRFVSHAAETVRTNGRPTCIIGTRGIASCGHETVATEGSTTVFAEGIGVHREGDRGRVGSSGYYIVDAASTNTNGG